MQVPNVFVPDDDIIADEVNDDFQYLADKILANDTVASSATPTIDTDEVTDFSVTALATNITSFTTNLSGTPENGQVLIVRIKDNGTARSIAWGASFVSRGATLPTTTVLGKYLYVGFKYNSQSSTWDCLAVGQEV